MLNDQQSCVMNGGFATQYSILKRGACQGDPISTYLFIKGIDIKGIVLYYHTFLFIGKQMTLLSSLETSRQLKC